MVVNDKYCASDRKSKHLSELWTKGHTHTHTYSLVWVCRTAISPHW